MFVTTLRIIRISLLHHSEKSFVKIIDADKYWLKESSIG